MYQKQYQAAWEEDMRTEKMNAEKRKMKLLEHRHEVDPCHSFSHLDRTSLAEETGAV
jgi:hypothetical protein